MPAGRSDRMVGTRHQLPHTLASRTGQSAPTDGRVTGLCGIEYGLQAAALHGALLAGGVQPAGYLAALRSVEVLDAWLDDPSCVLEVTAQLELSDPSGLIYGFQLRSSGGRIC